MALRLLYAAVVIVALVLGYKAYALHATMNMLQRAPFGNQIGKDDAPYTIVEFVDYRCHFCRALSPTLDALVEAHPDVRVVFRHLPVYDKVSLPDIDMALAAGVQGKFVDVHKKLMMREDPIDNAFIVETARELGLDYDKLKKDMKSGDIGNFLIDNINAAQLLGVNSTPLFLIGDTIYNPDGHFPTDDELMQVVHKAYE